MSKLRVRQPDGSVVEIPIGGGSGGSGEDGKTPYIQDGYWYIDGVNLGVKAEGEDGTDGVSPTVTTSKSGTVTTITITDKNGTKTAKINDGTNGKTPVKGTDYFTAADKAEMVNSVKNDFEENGLVIGDETAGSGEEATRISKNYIVLTMDGEGAYMTSEGKGNISFYDSDSDDNVILSNIAEPDGYYDAANKGYVDSKTTDKAETWTFTLSDGSTVTKKVVLG